MSSTRLPIQTGLDHRGGLGAGAAALFPPPGTLEALGGRDAIARLVDGLYDRFEWDPVLRPAFSRDLTSERERVFTPFHRLGHDGKGAGLGLSLVRQIARLHGGDAVVVPRDQSCFRVSLPVAGE